MVTLRTFPRRAWLAPLGTALTYALAALALAALLGSGYQWTQRTVNDVRFGVPRRDVVTGVVGHGDSEATPTHLVALNLDGQVSVLELPGGDANQVRVLAGPYLFGADGANEVPRIGLRDADGDSLPDLLLTIRGEVVVYLNRDGAFRLPTPDERAGLAVE